MEVEFKKRQLSCLENCLQEVRGAEQTLEIRLSEEMPDVGRILASWAQPVLRGKEWGVDSISCSAGMMVWVMYAPEDGSHPKVLEGWLPFQLRWDLPEGTGEGKFALELRTRAVDARTVSARKILVRGSLSAWAKAMVPGLREIYVPGETPSGVQLKKAVWPVLVPREAGEKRFAITEDLSLPAELPKSCKVLYAALVPEVQETKVIPGRTIFRGIGKVHICCQGQDGSLFFLDQQLPFSQYAPLDEMYEDGSAQVRMAVTSLETESGEEGTITVKAGLLGQYTVLERQQLEMVEDAYCPGRVLQLHLQEQQIPALLERREDRLSGTQKLPCQAQEILETQLLPDHPRIRSQENTITVEYPGITQVLYRDREGQLQGATGRWELKQSIPCAEGILPECAVTAVSSPQLMPGKDELELQWQQTCGMAFGADTPMTMATGYGLGEPQARDPHSPSVILRRSGQEGLWSLAKATGSTMEAILAANHLTDEPKPGTMLLVPVSG